MENISNFVELEKSNKIWAIGSIHSNLKSFTSIKNFILKNFGINDKLIMNYEGVTFDWKGNYYASYVRIGIYRDSDPSGAGYPDQVAHFDDFIVVSDKKTLDKYLD